MVVDDNFCYPHHHDDVFVVGDPYNLSILSTLSVKGTLLKTLTYYESHQARFEHLTSVTQLLVSADRGSATALVLNVVESLSYEG